MAVAPPGKLNVDEFTVWGSRSVDCFEKLEQIGEGTYGQVFMAREIATGEIVALKRIRMDNEREGFPITALREIKLLKKLNHANVIKLKEIVTSTGSDDDGQGNTDGNKHRGSIYMVFEYMDHDLTGLSDRPGMRFTIPQIKCYMKQLLTGLHYCHVNLVLHRDIKGSNLLIDNEGTLKLADFGLARSFSHDQSANLTNRVITLWYRPPELLLGATKYGAAVDMWSVGCIFAELLYGKPILSGKTEPEQLNKIYELCGSPDEVNWPGVSKMPWYNQFKPSRSMKRRLREVFRHFDRHALDLLDKMLTLDPSQRISASAALSAEYFWADPLPCDPKSLPRYESSHEFQTKKKRQQQRQNEEMAKKHKMQHPGQHTRLPPIQDTGSATRRWAAQNHPINASQNTTVVPAALGHHHHHHNSGPTRFHHQVTTNPNGGYNANPNPNHGSQAGAGGGYNRGGLYPQQGPGLYTGNIIPAAAPPPPQMSHPGAVAYPFHPPNYPQSNQLGPPNPGSSRDQQYGWPQ
uniref:Protein kinase domain-containing protein n=1 Tax=Kalanchoe fedtschenkoi TaxID=63787 RepID=A0A7N0T6T0_KALFE